MKPKFLLIFLLLLVYSCSGNEIYFDYKNIGYVAMPDEEYYNYRDFKVFCDQVDFLLKHPREKYSSDKNSLQLISTVENKTSNVLKKIVNVALYLKTDEAKTNFSKIQKIKRVILEDTTFLLLEAFENIEDPERIALRLANIIYGPENGINIYTHLLEITPIKEWIMVFLNKHKIKKVLSVIQQEMRKVEITKRNDFFNLKVPTNHLVFYKETLWILKKIRAMTGNNMYIYPYYLPLIYRFIMRVQYLAGQEKYIDHKRLLIDLKHILTRGTAAQINQIISHYTHKKMFLEVIGLNFIKNNQNITFKTNYGVPVQMLPGEGKKMIGVQERTKLRLHCQVNFNKNNFVTNSFNYNPQNISFTACKFIESTPLGKLFQKDEEEKW